MNNQLEHSVSVIPSVAFAVWGRRAASAMRGLVGALVVASLTLLTITDAWAHDFDTHEVDEGAHSDDFPEPIEFEVELEFEGEEARHKTGDGPCQVGVLVRHVVDCVEATNAEEDGPPSDSGGHPRQLELEHHEARGPPRA